MMRNWFRGSTIIVALAAATVGAVVSVAVRNTAGQGQDQGQAPRPAQTPEGRPNFNGVWQVNNEAHWNL